MYTSLSPKQIALYGWRKVKAWEGCDTLVATGAIRTGKTEIGSKGYKDDAIEMVSETPLAYRTKGFNLFTMVSTSKSLAYLNIIEPMINELELEGYKECEKQRAFYKSKRNTYILTGSPMGLLQIKDNNGDITRFLYIGADNKRAVNRVTGITVRGWFLDEAPLLGGNEEDNIAFIEIMYERTATFRTFPYGRPLQMMTTNPQDDEECLFYQRFIKGGFAKGIVVLSFELLDNPIFTEEDEDYYKKIFTTAQFQKKIKGRWVRDTELATFPKFDKDTHIKPHAEIMAKKYVELTIGLDEGQSDARAFVLAGFTKDYESVSYIDEYYYKNGVTGVTKDINDYIKDFWKKATEWYELFNIKMTLYYDSASLVLVEPLKRYRTAHKITTPVLIKPVNKKSVYGAKGKGSAIAERINFTNILFGANAIEISDKCKVLGREYSRSINKNGHRIDDGKSNKVDIQDASEYAVKHKLKVMQNKIMYKGARLNG